MGFNLTSFFAGLIEILNSDLDDSSTRDMVIDYVNDEFEYAKSCGLINED